MITIIILSYLIGWFICALMVYRQFREKGDIEEEIMAGVMGFITGALWPIVLFAFIIRGISNWLDTRLEVKNDVL